MKVYLVEKFILLSWKCGLDKYNKKLYEGTRKLTFNIEVLISKTFPIGYIVNSAKCGLTSVIIGSTENLVLILFILIFK